MLRISVSPYSVQMRENKDQKYSEYRRFNTVFRIRIHSFR